MKYSIKKQMLSLFIGMLGFILVAVFIANGNFLEKYYIHNKEQVLTQIYTTLDTLLSEDEQIDSEKLNEALGPIAEKSNVALIVTDVSGHARIRMRTDIENEELKVRLIGYRMNINQKNSELLSRGNNYEFWKAKDHVNQAEYLELWGTFANGDLFLIRSPLESIRESVGITNRFLGYIGICVLAVSVVIVWFFSKRITQPILELTDISQRMANLDFDAKYTGKCANEIAVLGANFNKVSEKLEQMISELKSANNELQKDIEKKEKLEQMRTEFLGNVSHELKTPIALIQGYAEGLKEGVSDDPESRAFYCDVIMDEANKMNQMVRNLLTLNQLEFGDEEVTFERFDIVQLVKGVLQSCEILIQQKGVNVNCVMAESVSVWGDEFKTEQVIRNYISNALNHVAGENIIEIKIVEREKTVRVSVFNSGHPIPEEDIPHIWEKFYKVDKAHTREYGGNGIGLSIVKAIMESFHKEYGVKNYENGVEFYMELDLR